jgi:membrane protein
MGFGRKLGARLLDGAVVIAAVALAWKLQKQSEPVAETYHSGSATVRQASPVMAGGIWPTNASWSWWWGVLSDTYEAMAKDRLLAVAAGVVFYALLAIVPAITAFVSFYGLFAHPRTVQDHLSLLVDVMPAGSIAILEEQIARLAAQPSGLSIGFIVGTLVALWSANAGVKAMIDALNVIEGRDESRSFVRLNLTSLTLTLGAIVFLLMAIGAVVAFPLVMSTFGLKPFIGMVPWLARWPVLFAVMVAMLAVFYRLGPSRTGMLRPWLTLGVLVAALAWLAGSAALSFYLSNFADYNATYGSLGAAVGLMMWMWLSTIAVLIGAQFDTVIERRAAPTATKKQSADQSA